MWGYGYPMAGYGYGGFGIMDFVFSILWVVILVVVIVTIVRWARHGRIGRRGGHWYGNDALDILKERYAKGELTKDEFETMKKDIEA